ncbi:MAG: hypothetical protein EBS86_09195 [Crocinitomicaceae bacterium]|nr:hypothetical protein [Crocinitomicaceae bacterium]
MHLIIFVWGFTGILGKLIHLDAIVIVWYRVMIAPFFLALFFIFTKRSFKIDFKHLWKIVIVGIFVASHWLTFYYSIQLSTASLGVLCLSTTTLHVTWLEPIVMKRKFSWIEFQMSHFRMISRGTRLITGTGSTINFVPVEKRERFSTPSLATL